MMHPVKTPPLLTLAGQALLGAALCLLPLCLAAAPTTGKATTGLLPLPKPNLESLEEAARKKIESAQNTLERFAQKGDTPGEAMSEGHAFLGQLYHAYGLHDAAEICYRNARSLAPADVRWPYLLGLVYNSKGDFQPALEAYRQVLARTPDDFPALIRLGNAQLELGQGEAAKATFERARAKDSANAAAAYGLGKTLALLGEDRGAIESFEKALALQPEASVIHYPLGQAYRRLGQLDKAKEHLQLRGQKEPGFDDPLGRQVSLLARSTAFEVLLDLASDTEAFDEEQFLGFALSQFATNKSAVQQLRQGLGQLQDPGRTETRGRIYYAMGGLLVNAGQDEEAVSALFKAIELAPDLLDARIKLGNAFARAANFDQALGQYEKVLQLRPTHMATLVKHAVTLMSLQRFAEAKADLLRIHQMEPTHREALIRLAQCHEHLAETSAAMARYRAALALDLNAQERTEVPFHIALLERQDGKIEAAEASFRQSLAADEEFRPALSGLASLLAQGSRLKEAAELYNKLAGLEPDLLAPRLAEATALILSSQHAAAKERLEAGIVLFPEETQLKDILARHLAACPDLSIRDGRRAVELAEAVFNQLPTLESTETLAMAYAEAGRFKDAVEWQKQLLLKVPENADPKGLHRLRANLVLYESGQRCCATSG